MLTVKSIPDIFAYINLVDDLVCIFLESCCEDNDFVIFSHCFDKLNAARSHKEETIILVFYVVNQCLI